MRKYLPLPALTLLLLFFLTGPAEAAYGEWQKQQPQANPNYNPNSSALYPDTMNRFDKRWSDDDRDGILNYRDKYAQDPYRF